MSRKDLIIAPSGEGAQSRQVCRFIPYRNMRESPDTVSASIDLDKATPHV